MSYIKVYERDVAAGRANTYLLPNGVSVTVPANILERVTKVARTDPDRRLNAEQSILVPISWLVGERVGY